MELVTMLVAVVTFPLLCLGFLLWMAHLEDSLPAAVRRAERTPDPPPILAVPVTEGDEIPPAPLTDEGVHAPVTVEPVVLPVQRSAPPTDEPEPDPAASGAA